MTRDEKITQNLGLVHACCKRFVGHGIEYDDLFQAGSVGLIKAVDGFDPTRGLQLSTYAVPVILGEIKRLFRDGGTVKVSRSLKELSLKATRMSGELSKKLDREPTVKELATALKVTAEEAAEAICAAKPAVSLTFDSDDGDTQLDLPVDSHENSALDKISIGQLLSTLPQRDRKLIWLRYFKSMTQVQTAKVLGMTQVQVSRREKAILGIMKNELLE